MKKTHIVFKNRGSKARKILKIIKKFKPKGTNILSIGVGSGEIEDFFVKRGFKVHGIDVVDERTVKSFTFQKVKDMNLPFRNGVFDIVISNHVIEHTYDQNTHLSEINRVMKKTGLCYLSTPNKFAIIEPHYKLPLLSWIPKSWSSRILYRLGKNDVYDINPLSRYELRRLAEINSFFFIEETKYALGLFLTNELKLRFLVNFSNLIYPLIRLNIPTFIVILKQRDVDKFPKRYV